MNARILKQHVQGHRFTAVVMNEAGDVLFRPYRQNWTKASRLECYDWAREHDYNFKRLPQDVSASREP